LITQIRGVLRSVQEETLTLAVEPFELEVLIPEHTRRQIQGKVGEVVTLHTTFYIEGQAMGGRLTPRLIGFLSTIDREFFDTFCSVDGVGMKKALRAMVRPVREIARTIQEQDVKMLSTFPGIGEATAERIVAKLRRKVGIYALIVNADGTPATPAPVNGEAAQAQPDVVSDAYAMLLAVGHSEMQARAALDRVLAGRKKFKSVSDLIEAIYQQEKP
jgi:Holliday junction DNA helicase RuvA